MRWTSINFGLDKILAGFTPQHLDRLDPHLVWASRTYLKDVSQPNTPIPVMFEAKVIAGVAQIPPTVNLIEGTAYLFSPFFTGFVKLKDLLAFADDVERFRIGVVAVPKTRKQGPPAKPLLQIPLHPQRSDVVIGIIDHGIAFANKRFAVRDAAGHWRSRIERIWDQQWGYPSKPEPLPDALRASHQSPVYQANFWKAVPHYGYGRELTNEPGNAQIDFWLNHGSSEAEVYRHLCYLPAQHDRAHGTHVLGVAAGALSYGFDNRSKDPTHDIADPAARANIIAVQLPALPYKDTSGMGLCVQVLDAVSYIALHAAGRKVVINLSDGAYAGPHDGNGLLERALDGFFAAGNNRRAFVVAAGNQFDERVHWKSDVLPGPLGTELSWSILPDDNSDSHLEIWPAPGSASDKLEVSVTPPGRAACPFVPWSSWWELADPVTLDTYAAVMFPRDPPNSAPAAGPRAMMHIAVKATRTKGGSKTVTAPHGVWKVTLRNMAAKPIEFDAYIERDNPALGDSGPRRQSHFIHPAYPRSCVTMAASVDDSDNPSPIKRMGALNNVASSRAVLVVGAHVFQTGQLASYSASGPGRASAASIGVDVLAVSDCSTAVRGIRGYAVRSGASFRMDGTSVSTPQVTRWIANWMASDGTPLPNWSTVLSGSVSKVNPVLRGPLERTGDGRLT